ncbi:unknown [Ruminococcus sp. CAG:563]|nr:unknown [Ruminococcus sp. CAG:563]
MIGIGKWEASINTMLFRGTGRVTISDKNGQYDFKLEIVGENAPAFRVTDVVEEGNTLRAVAESDMFKGKKIPVTATFDGDSVVGTAKLPFIGNIKLSGHRIDG